MALQDGCVWKQNAFEAEEKQAAREAGPRTRNEAR